jgi:hypothetical protein
MHGEAVLGAVVRYRCRDPRCPSVNTGTTVTVERRARLGKPYASSGDDYICGLCGSAADEVRSSR